MAWSTVLVIIAMVGINAVLAAFELALASVSVTRLRELVEQKRAGAQAALAMKNRMEASLAVVQLGITLVGAVAAAVGGAGAVEGLSPWLQQRWALSETAADVVALAVVIAPLSGITIVAGELVPKSFAIRHADWVCLHLSPAMSAFAYSVHPVVLAFEWVTQRIVHLLSRGVDRDAFPEPIAGLNELLANARALRVSRVISPQQERMILGAGRLSSKRVNDILVLPAEIRMLDAEGRLIEHLVTVHLEAHTRFLVTERAGDPEAIIGYVNVKDLFFLAKSHPQNPNIREITRPLMSVSPDASIGEAFSRMMASHVHLAIVRDNEGRVCGMITLEDILEEVVGDIQDEFDRLPRNLARAGRQWVVGGGLPLGRLREALNRPELAPGLPAQMSLNDWVASQHGRSLEARDYIKVDGVYLLIRKVRRQKIMEALLDTEPRGDLTGTAGQAAPEGGLPVDAADKTR